MYITSLVIPVPEAKLDAYRAWARNSADIFKDFGCIEVVEAVGDFIPEGKQTDFRRAVQARDDEKVVLTWQIWPSKQALEEGEARMHESGRLDTAGEPPFDASRLILGCFEPLLSFGRG